MEAFRLEGMERVKTWHAEGPPRRHFMTYVSADLNRALADSGPIDPNDRRSDRR